MGQNCSDLLQNRGKTQEKLFQNRGKWRICCCKKGASAPSSLLYISVILYQNHFISVALHTYIYKHYLYQHYFI